MRRRISIGAVFGMLVLALGAAACAPKYDVYVGVPRILHYAHTPDSCRAQVADVVLASGLSVRQDAQETGDAVEIDVLSVPLIGLALFQKRSDGWSVLRVPLLGSALQRSSSEGETHMSLLYLIHWTKRSE